MNNTERTDYYVDAIVRLKEEYGLTYTSIAKRLGVSISFISKVIHGVKALPMKYAEQIDKMVCECQVKEN